MMLNFTGEEVYGADEPPKFEWSDDRTHLWYEERPRMILQFYRPIGHWKPQSDVVVFVNMAFHPTSENIEACIHRGLKAGGIEYKGVKNLRLNSWSGNVNAYWHADIEVIP